MQKLKVGSCGRILQEEGLYAARLACSLSEERSKFRIAGFLDEELKLQVREEWARIYHSLLAAVVGNLNEVPGYERVDPGLVGVWVEQV